MNGGSDISYEIALRWMPQDLTDDESTLVQGMAWCHQAMQQAITWANVDPDLCYHMASLGHNCGLVMLNGIVEDLVIIGSGYDMLPVHCQAIT